MNTYRNVLLFLVASSLLLTLRSPAATLVVTNRLDDGPGSFRQTVADALAGDTVTFAPEAYGTIVISNSPLFLDKDLVILGPGASTLSLRGTMENSVFFAAAGNVFLANLAITKGQADYGGGVQQFGGTLTISNCLFAGNIATNLDGLGGGIYVAAGTLTVINSTFAANVGKWGGAVNVSLEGQVEFRNSTFFLNTATTSGAQGGAIWSAGTVDVRSCTIASNTVSGFSFGGGIRRSGGTVRVRNSIIAANSAFTESDVSGIPFVSQGYNLIGNATLAQGFTNNANGDQVGTPATPIDPLFGPPDSNIMPLLPESPAIDKGNSFGFTTDQRGATRPFDFPAIPNASGGDGSDIGAYELGLRLEIHRSGRNAVLSWVTNAANFRLEKSPDFPASNWSNASGTPIVSGRLFYFTNDASVGNTFYRLAYP
jgi:hypothetical protein